MTTKTTKYTCSIQIYKSVYRDRGLFACYLGAMVCKVVSQVRRSTHLYHGPYISHMEAMVWLVVSFLFSQLLLSAAFGDL